TEINVASLFRRGDQWRCIDIVRMGSGQLTKSFHTVSVSIVAVAVDDDKATFCQIETNCSAGPFGPPLSDLHNVCRGNITPLDKRHRPLCLFPTCETWEHRQTGCRELQRGFEIMFLGGNHQKGASFLSSSFSETR